MLSYVLYLDYNIKQPIGKRPPLYCDTVFLTRDRKPLMKVMEGITRVF